MDEETVCCKCGMLLFMNNEIYWNEEVCDKCFEENYEE